MNTKPKIVLAEDDYGLQTAYTDYLKCEGFTVVAVTNAEDLVKQATKAEVLVVDARLPKNPSEDARLDKLEGIEAIGNLVAGHKIALTVPVIFISVHAESDEVCDRVFQVFPNLKGRFIWLQKRFECELLVVRIREELQNRSKAE